VIAAIVLAAGTASRMGRPKLLLPMADGRALVRLSVERVLAGDPDAIFVVVGAEASAVETALRGLPITVVVNPRYAEGQATSLRAGLAALGPETEAVLVALGDQPLPDPTIVRRLITTFRETGGPIVVPRYREGRGNPVVFAASLFDELEAVTGDQGARGVVAREPGRVREVVIDAATPRDVDTWADYEALRDVRNAGWS
jgi:molybdenum cofactor cytidylyltransferase